MSLGKKTDINKKAMISAITGNKQKEMLTFSVEPEEAFIISGQNQQESGLCIQAFH